MKEPVTVVIVNYNGLQYLKDEIDSIKASDYPNVSIMLADDCSTDDSVQFVKKNYPDVKILQMDRNERLYGRYPLANRVRNAALEQIEDRLVFLLDNDVTLAVDCISKLVEMFEKYPDCAVCTPRVMYSDEPDTIYADGAMLHYVGTSIVRNRDRKLFSEPEPPKYSLGCGIQMLDRHLAKKVDYTDANFIIGWGDDGEFHHRMNIAGFRCYNVPQAMIYHPRKDAPFATAAHVKNRWWILFTSFSSRTLFWSFPALFVYEFFLFFFVLMKGEMRPYWHSVHDLFKNFKVIMKKRKKTQAMRVVPDRELIVSGDVFAASKHVGQNFLLKFSLNALNKYFDFHWFLIKKLI